MVAWDSVIVSCAVVFRLLCFRCHNTYNKCECTKHRGRHAKIFGWAKSLPQLLSLSLSLPSISFPSLPLEVVSLAVHFIFIFFYFYLFSFCVFLMQAINQVAFCQLKINEHEWLDGWMHAWMNMNMNMNITDLNWPHLARHISVRYAFLTFSVRTILLCCHDRSTKI